MALIATVRLNEQDKGELAMVLEGEGRFLLPRAQVAQWLVLPPGLPEVNLDGEPHVALEDIPGARVRFDEARLALQVDVPPETFAVQRLRYNASDRPMPTEADRVSAILNYQLGVAGSTRGDSRQLSGAIEPALRWKEWLLRSQSYYSHSTESSRTTRGLTALTRDDPFRLTRLTLGDFAAPVSDLGGGYVLAGISYGRAFEFDPYTPRQPGAAFRTMVQVPSQLEVYVGDARLMGVPVAPGPLELSNLTYLAGRRDVRVVLRDAFGRTQEVAFPFYFADRGLAQGLHDFQYGAGSLRRTLLDGSTEYGTAAFTAFHRYGVSDFLTIGAQAEGSRDVVDGGPTLTLRSDNLGVLSLGLLASHDRETSRSGVAGALAYSYQRGAFTASLATRRADRAFRVVQAFADTLPPLSEDFASASWSSPRWGTLSASVRESRARDEPVTRGATVTYSRPITREWIVQAAWRRTTGPLANHELLLSLQYVAPPSLTAYAAWRDDGRTRGASLQVARLRPEGEGVGYSLGAETTSGDGRSVRTVSPEVIWNSRYATLQANAVQSSGSGASSSTLYNVSLAGAAVAVGGNFGFSRPIDDSFAIARVVPPAPDVRLYLNQQFMGRTDASGRVFLPSVVSYVGNQVSVDSRDLPMDRSLVARDQLLVPWSRSGALVTFEAPVTRSLSGRFTYRAAGVVKPLELVLVMLTVGGRPVEVPVARGGDFYFENVAAGDYPATVEIDGRACRFTMRIPASETNYVQLGEVETCALP